MNIKRFFQSFRDAGRGFVYIWKHEQNFRLQCALGFIVVGWAMYLQVSKTEYVVLLGLILLVLLAEILNSVLEKFIDLLKPRLHHQVEVVKDVLAAMVLCMSLGAGIIGIIIFFPYIFG
jgi:undecaprenol kinase